MSDVSAVERQMAEATESDRSLKDLLQASTKTGPPANMSLAQLALIVKHHVGIANQQAVKTKLAEDVSILGLYQAYSRTLIQTDSLENLALRSDSNVRNHLAQNLPITDLVHAWELQNKVSDSLKKQLWTLVMTRVSDPTYFHFPDTTSPDVQQLIVQSRCKEEASFLQFVKRDTLMQIVKDQAPGNMYLNLPRKELCEIVADLNAITRSKTAKAVAQCEKDLKDYKQEGLSMQNPPYDTFLKETQYFEQAVQKWKSNEQQYMDNQATGNLIELHKFRKHLIEFSEGCSKRISAARKAYLKEKQEAGGKLSFKEMIQRYV